MNRPKLLDLFCGAGGASMGYYRAGFEVEGVDIKPQTHYPFKFYQADALIFPLEGYDAYHASPPCELYSVCVYPSDKWQEKQQANPDYIQPTREMLMRTGKPFVIENVPGAPLINFIKLSGTMFGLKTIKERWFELNGFDILLSPTPWDARGKVKSGEFVGIMRHGGNTLERTKREHLAEGYAINWGMTRQELREAIPPAYTEYIGKHLLLALNRNRQQGMELKMTQGRIKCMTKMLNS